MKRQALEKVDYPVRPKSAYPTLAFARLAKAVRRTLVLEGTLGRMRLPAKAGFVALGGGGSVLNWSFKGSGSPFGRGGDCF